MPTEISFLGTKLCIKPIPYQFLFLTQTLFLSYRKNDLGCSSRIPDPNFFPSRIQG
jgi:hypothetical protein